MSNDEKKISELNQTASEGAAYLEMARTQGFKLLQAKIQSLIADVKNKWLDAKPEEAEVLRQQIKAYQNILKFTQDAIQKGNAARLTIDFLKKEDVTPTEMVDKESN